MKESCFCGRSQVEELLGRPRKDCTEPVPSCQKRCGRILPCGHPCNKLCHSGECECGLEVQKRCRCNGKAYKIPCHLQMEDVLCDRVCKKKKSCGVHTCDLVCCISVAHSLEHTCMEHCGKMLNCGLHPCPKKCHTGKCGDCSIMMNQRLRCACGDKQIPAPTKCGTLNPVCDIVCNKALPCGHNCYYKCHFGDCKPCQEIISKPCACKKKIIPGSICSMKMYCGLSCTNLLDCGHACGITCHDEDCRTLLQQRKEELLKQGIEISEGGCTQSCGVSREACGHPCEALCHPHKPCPLEPCKYMINITCACGKPFSLREQD